GRRTLVSPQPDTQVQQRRLRDGEPTGGHRADGSGLGRDPHRDIPRHAVEGMRALPGTDALRPVARGPRGVCAMTIVLSPEQLAILATPSGPLRIDAGAGTGKTFTLVRLVAEWVTAGTPPERILGITFTNKAAAELASRIRHEVASALD